MPSDPYLDADTKKNEKTDMLRDVSSLSSMDAREKQPDIHKLSDNQVGTS